MMIARPLRVACGSGHPQFRQNEVEKVRAVERSKRATLSSPDNQRNACGKTYAFAEHALPVALRHREQLHFINLMNGRSTSNSTNPQRHPPRTDISHLYGPVCEHSTAYRRWLQVTAGSRIDRPFGSIGYTTLKLSSGSSGF